MLHRFPRLPTRRGFLGHAAALGGAAVLPACGDDSETTPEPEPDPVFSHGVASGDPLSDRVILWTRVTTTEAEAEVSWVIATDAELTEVVASGTVTTDESLDHTVKIDADGLSPSTTYYYRFAALDEESVVGRTRTLPVGETPRLRFAVVSCSSLSHGYFHVYANVAARADLDAVIHLGDYIYEYGDDEYGSIRENEPPHEIVSLEDYRLRYAHYRRDADLQEAHRQHPFFAVWDDHEFANNSWNGGADNHDPETEGSFADRKIAAARAYSEWMPIRLPDPSKIYRSFQIGDLVELFLLDTRIWGRDEQAIDKEDPSVQDPERQLLGEDQEAWLFDGLRSSTARFKLVGQQVMMAPLPIDALINTDQWDGYPAARERFYGVLDRSSIDDVVVLTGDIHTSWASDLIPEGVTYDPATGAGSIAVELVTPGITSPGLGELFVDIGAEIELDNPRFKLVELTKRGYLILDVTHERLQAAFFHVSDVESEARPDEVFTRALKVATGSNRLVEDGDPA